MLWSVSPGLDGWTKAGFLLSPYIWVGVVFAVFFILERQSVTRLSAALSDVRIVDGRNVIGNVYAGGNVTISEAVHERPASSPVTRMVLSAVVSGIVGLVVAKTLAAQLQHTTLDNFIQTIDLLQQRTFDPTATRITF